MKKNALIYTNPYLVDEAMREKLIARSVDTSCGVEGISVKDGEVSKFKIKQRKPKKIYQDLANQQ